MASAQRLSRVIALLPAAIAFWSSVPGCSQPPVATDGGSTAAPSSVHAEASAPGAVPSIQPTAPSGPSAAVSAQPWAKPLGFRQVVDEARALYPPTGSAAALLLRAWHGPSGVAGPPGAYGGEMQETDVGFGTTLGRVRRSTVGVECLTLVLAHGDRVFESNTECSFYHDRLVSAGYDPGGLSDRYGPPADHVARLLSPETLAAGTHDADSILFSYSDPEVRAQARAAIAPELGPVPPVTVPPALEDAHRLLTADPVGATRWEVRVGDGCGFNLVTPAGREAIQVIVEAGRTDIVRDIARGLNPGGRVYAAMALWKLPHTAEDDVLIQAIRKQQTPVPSCGGCTDGRAPAAVLFRSEVEELCPFDRLEEPPGGDRGDPLDDPLCDAASGVRLTRAETDGILQVTTGDGAYSLEHGCWDRVWMGSSTGQRCQVLAARGTRGGAPPRPNAYGKVHRTGPRRFRIEPAVVDTIVEDLRRSSIRVLFGKSGDELSEIRLFRVERGSVLGTFAMRDGDHVVALDGLELSDPQSTQAAFERLRRLDRFTITVRRSYGGELVLDIAVERTGDEYPGP